jgi:hypothetical protein
MRHARRADDGGNQEAGRSVRGRRRRMGCRSNGRVSREAMTVAMSPIFSG